MTRKGIILAGGSGTRLYPLTQVVSKQLLPVYDKPMIYYPLATLMLAGIREELVINTPHEQALFQRLLGDGSQWGLDIRYAVQPSPDGRERGATVFGYWVRDPQRYGVAEFDATGRVIGLEEKPAQPKSSYAVTGLYFYDGRVCDFAAALKPSARGELEITDLNRCYLDDNSLHLEQLGRGFAWLDTGTHDSLMEAGSYIETIENRQGLKVCCPEEIAHMQGWIDAEQLLRLAAPLAKTGYGQYLQQLTKQGYVQ